MSETILYSLGENPQVIGEARNAWRGAMYVWNDIAKRYFGLEGFPMFGPMSKKIWNAADTKNLPLHEAVVLLSTMDFATIRAGDAKEVAEHFDRYGQEHPNSSFSEQAKIIREAELKEGDLIAWQQTSVSEFWGDEDDGWYSVTGDKHFDAYAEAQLKSAKRDEVDAENKSVNLTQKL
jgi:hypothetical protein